MPRVRLPFNRLFVLSCSGLLLLAVGSQLAGAASSRPRHHHRVALAASTSVQPSIFEARDLSGPFAGFGWLPSPGATGQVLNSTRRTLVNNAPLQPTELPHPDNGTVSADPSEPFWIKYSDPDGDAGQLTFNLYTSGGTLVQTQVHTGIVSGDYPPTWFNSTISPGSYYWNATPQDIHGLNGPISASYSFTEVAAPVVPSLDSPVGTVASPSGVTSLTPVLKAHIVGNSTQLGFQFQVATSTNCTSTVTVTSPIVSATFNGTNMVATWAVDPNKLANGVTYYWCARTWTLPSVASSAWSTVGGIIVKIPSLGQRGYWPMFQHGPLAVNEATGNLVLSMPGPSYQTGIGTLSAAPTYNSLDTRNAAAGGLSGLGAGWVLGTVGNIPAKLIDHNLFTGAEQYDALELVSGDGSSDYYAHVGSSQTYQGEPGDPSQITKNGDGTWTLSEPDGSFYTFQATPASDHSYPLASAQIAIGTSGQADYLVSSSAGQISSIAAQMNGTTLATLTFNWTTCTGAALCIKGPDGRTWKYVVDGSGRLIKVTRTATDGVTAKDIAAVAYGTTSGLVETYQNANDLNPTDTTLNGSDQSYLAAHAITIAYTSSKVTSVTDGPIRASYQFGTGTRTPVWTFAYSCSTGNTLPTPAVSHPGTTFPSSAFGCTELKPPNQQPSGTKVARVWYDPLFHPLKSAGVVDGINGTYSLSLYNGSNQLLWTEDQTGAPTDYAYDPVDGTLSSVTGPDPDGAGSLGRVTTSYRYDETVIGTPTAAGTPLAGLKAEYFNGSTLNLRPIVTQNDTNIADTWAGAPATGVNADNFYVRWSGDLVVAAGQNGNWMFSTVATGGTRLIVDGTELINLWGGQTDAAPACSPSINLAAGKHSIVVEYKDSGSGTADVALHAAKGTTCSLADSLIPDAAKNLTLQPAWLNQTSVVAPANTSGGSGRISFSHYATPATQDPDYSLVQSGGSNYITAYTYDSFGRLAQKWMPKGNASRTIDVSGNLTGTPDNNYLTTVAYYAPTDQAAPDASCTASSAVNQLGLQKSTTDAGLTTTTSVYNGDGDPLSVRNGKGVSCFNYDNQERLASQQDIGGTSTTTSYVYQPDDLVYSATDLTGTVKTDRNEADWPIGSTDTYGSLLSYVFDQEGNPVNESRQFAPLNGLNTITKTFNEGDQLTSESDYKHRSYSFFYNTRGDLVGVNYPTTTATFSYKTIDAAGWLDSVVNRHGTLTSPVGKATGAAPTSAPADSSPLGDYTYTYFQDGQRLTEAAKLGTAAAQTTTYAYDPIGRLQTVNFPDTSSRRYCFDLDSNRTRWNTSTTGDCTTGTAGATYSYSATKLDQLSSVTQGTATTNYTYNGDGDTTGRNTDTLSYDVRDRLSGATVAGRTVSYEYDPASFMHKRSVLTSYLGATLESQPANYWRLDETTGTSATDRIAGKNGTYTGGYTLNQTGALTASGDSDPAISLNGTTGWITTPVTLSTAQLAHFSLETWIKFATAPTSTVTIVGINGSVKLQLDRNRVIQASYIDGVGTTHNVTGPNGNMTVGAWHHIVMIYDGSQLRVWVDGVQASGAFASPAGNANTLSIGRTSGNSDWFNGQIDDISLYTRALTPGEVQNHHTRGLNAPATTNVYYRFGGSVETADPSTNPSITNIDTNAPDGTNLAHDTEDPLSLATATNFLYYNGHGDLAIETDNTGTITATHSYDPFGAALDTTAGNNTLVATNGTTERYTAAWNKKTDISTNLIQMGARPYDPTTGRFYSTDPVLGGSLNNYDYAGQDPINGYDLDGRREGDPGGREEGETLDLGEQEARDKVIAGEARSGEAQRLPLPGEINAGNLKNVNPRQLFDDTGQSAHEIKDEYFGGHGAQLSRLDIKYDAETNHFVIVEKGSGRVVEVTYYQRW